MEVVHVDGSVLAHRFEVGGLGKAPFRYIGCSESYIKHADGTTQASGTCDYCGTGIRYVFYIESSDGKKSGVGCDCIRHYNDSKLVVKVESEMRRLAKESKITKAKDNVKSLVNDYNDALKFLTTVPHPNAYFASVGKTYADYCKFFMIDPITFCSPVKAVKLMKQAIKTAKSFKESK